MAEYQKNQELELMITALGNEGEGIGHTEDGYTVFVKDALPGDQIRTKLQETVCLWTVDGDFIPNC